LITSKKKYIAKVVYDKTTGEYPVDDYTIKGMEFKKSNLSNIVKDFLLDMAQKIMAGIPKDDIGQFLQEQFYRMSAMPIDDITFAQGVKNIAKYTSQSNVVVDNTTSDLKGGAFFPKHCPYHVAGAIVMNALIEKIPALREMDMVSEGDKGKIAFVCPNNVFGIKALTYVGKWNPALYDIFKIDVEYMFQRLIIGPMKPIFQALRWNLNMDNILKYKFVDAENTLICKQLF